MTALAAILVIAGAALMVAEAHVPAHGVLSTGAAAALTGAVVLALSGAGAPAGAVVAAGVAVALAALVLAGLLPVKSLATRRLAVRSGSQALVGRVANRALDSRTGRPCAA
jgi:membrane-bound serine protease (ClpP class)